MTIVKRLVKGSKLTAAEFDGNLDDLVAQVAAKVPTTRTLTAGAGLTGGGDLSADRSFAVAVATESEVQAGTESAKPVAPDQLKPREAWIYALSDETTALTTGNNKLTVRAPYAFKLAAVRASVSTAPAGSTVIVDINVAGSTILSTKLSIDAGEKTSTTAASAAVISTPAIADDAEITFDIDQIGSGTAGAGLKVYLIGNRD